MRRCCRWQGIVRFKRILQGEHMYFLVIFLVLCHLLLVNFLMCFNPCRPRCHPLFFYPLIYSLGHISCAPSVNSSGLLILLQHTPHHHSLSHFVTLLLPSVNLYLIHLLFLYHSRPLVKIALGCWAGETHHTEEQMDAARYDEGRQDTPDQHTRSTHPINTTTLTIRYQNTLSI